jgi:solute carrier family 25 protein 16
MPEASVPHHEPTSQQSSTQSANIQDMTAAVHAEPSALARTRQRQPVLCPTDDDAIVPDTKPKLDKQSVEYVVKSGIAGGLAGCAVRWHFQ